MGYHRFKSGGVLTGSFEVYFVSKELMWEMSKVEDEPTYTASGWYWRSCWPGCLPDSDPVGPFNSELAAINDAQKED